jgi:hypothetical protein
LSSRPVFGTEKSREIILNFKEDIKEYLDLMIYEIAIK